MHNNIRKMKTSIKLICASLAAMMMAASCAKEVEQTTFSSDPEAILEVPCQNPADQILNLQTNANWIVITPSWVKATPVFGSGNTTVSFAVDNLFVNEKTDVEGRSGEIVFSGGGKSYKVAISQLGYTAPFDPLASIGGIPDVTEFMKFVEAVNTKDALTRWQNEAKEIVLLDDIDLSEYPEWTPIGNVSSVTNGNYAGGYPENDPAFKGVFDGQNHKIIFKPNVKVADKGTFGLFGAIDGATIKNLTIEADATFAAEKQADCGILVGTAVSSTIENVKVNGNITSKGSDASARYSVAGIVGFMFNNNPGISEIKNCTTNLVANLECGKATSNGAAGSMYGGIVGFVTTTQDGSENIIENCVSNGSINGNMGRSSGIAGTSNVCGHFKDCTNNANQVNTNDNGRIGNVVSMMNVSSIAENCVNNGDLTCTGASTTAGGLFAMTNNDNVVIIGGKNNGTIANVNTSYRGLICANWSKFKSASDVVVSGGIGTYKEGGVIEKVDVNAGNFMDYIGTISAANKEKLSNFTWDGAPAAEPGIKTADELIEFASLVNSGADYSKFVIDGAVILGKDIDLAGAVWTPIGAACIKNDGSVLGGTPFTGIFDGKGHCIDNFKVNVDADADDCTAAGLFGALNGATVKNVVVGANAVLDGKSKKASYIGGVAGFILSSTIDGCTNKASLCVTAATENIRECLAGIVGEMYTLEGNASYVKNCVNEGKVTSKNSVNTKNGGTGLSVAGIVGFSDGKEFNFIQDCTNKATIEAEATRQSGIVASANANTKVEGCVNEGKIIGKDVKASNSRIAGIASAASAGCFFTNCINKADVSFAIAGDSTHGYAAGILGQANNIVSIEACENYGTITSDMIKADTKMMGIIIANANSKKVTIKSCKVGGKIGPVTEDDNYKMTTITPENYEANITLATSKAGSVVLEGNVCGN